MADQLTEEQIAELREAFELFGGSVPMSRYGPSGLFGRAIPVASPTTPLVTVTIDPSSPTEDPNPSNTTLRVDETAPISQATRPVPLQSTVVNVTSLDGFAKIDIAYSFINISDDKHDLEATLFLPKQPKAAVSGLKLSVKELSGGFRTVIGIVEEKAIAEVYHNFFGFVVLLMRFTYYRPHNSLV